MADGDVVAVLVDEAPPGNTEIENETWGTKRRQRVAVELASDLTALPSRDAAEEVALTRLPFTLTTSGDNDLVTPAAGKRIRLRRVTPIISDPDGTSNPLLKLFVGPTGTPANEVARGYIISGRFDITGPVNGHVFLNLSKNGDVSGTLFYSEVV